VGKLEGKRPLVRSGYRWEDNIKMDLLDLEFGGMVWIEVAQDGYSWPLVSEVMKLWVT
jgi:hypothetical protein